MRPLSLFALALLATLAGTAQAAFVSGQAASSELGQENLYLYASPSPPTAASLDLPLGVAVDPTTGKVFVSDQGNHRILRFAAADAYINGASAEAVFGQADFSSNLVDRGGSLAANTLDHPSSICVDAAGRLWVCDYGNFRVLRFDQASTKASGADADGVLGQPDFTTGTMPATASAATLHRVSCVATDSAGTLWVGDSGWNRVLRFDHAAEKANGAAADGVLGQANFTSTAAATSAVGMRSVSGVSEDSEGRLWVADGGNSRVLRFDGAATKANGAAADGLLGQLYFNVVIAMPSPAATIQDPSCITAAPDGTVWVGDYLADRVVGFSHAATKATGAEADVLLGQPDFTSHNSGISPFTFSHVAQIAIAGTDTLFIVDSSDSRVLRFVELPAPTLPTLSTSAKITAKNGKARIRGSSANSLSVTYRVGKKGPFKPVQGTPANWTIALKKLPKGTTKVTIQATDASGHTTQTTVRVKAK